MRFLLFSEFEELNEIKYTRHWMERTADSKFGEDDRISRIVPHSKKTQDGWSIEGYIDKRRKNLSPLEIEEFLSNLPMSKSELEEEIGMALREITRSKKLEEWESHEKVYQLLELGRIGIYNGLNTIYPLFSTLSYPPADGIFGISARNDGITVMYFPKTELGMLDFYETAKKNSGVKSELEFRYEFGTYSPYGKDFELIIDGADPDRSDRIYKLKKQIAGEKINYGRSLRSQKINPTSKIPKQKTISLGMEMDVIIGYVSKEIPTGVVVREILNLEEIKKSPSKINEVKLSVVPLGQDHIKRKSTGEILAIPITISSGSVVVIDGIKYRVKEPPSIVNDVRIMERGSVAIWVSPVQE